MTFEKIIGSIFAAFIIVFLATMGIGTILYFQFPQVVATMR